MSNPAFPVEAKVRLVEAGSLSHGIDEHTVVLGDSIKINTSLIERYFCSSATLLAQDLMTVVGAVKYADRIVKRHHAKAWGRSINIEVPVWDKSLWASPSVQSTLSDCLNFLTGDEWSFQFKCRRKKSRQTGQLPAPLALTEPHVFIPYSHGLDSYAQLKLLQHKDENTRVVCVYTDTRGIGKTWKELCKANRKSDFHTIPIPVSMGKISHGEPSFSTRPFTYYLIASYGAILHEDSRVLIPENGQGSIGGSLVTLGGEAPHRSCHPGFTFRLTKFINELTGKRVVFEHPALFQTKGQVLKSLLDIDHNFEGWLREHRSCSHDHRHSSAGGVRVHCGVCGNCILRRVSIMAAGIMPQEKYKYHDLSATSLEQAIIGEEKVPRDIGSFEDLARNSVHSMSRFAALADTPDAAGIWAEAAMLERYRNEPAKIMHSHLTALLLQHREEWHRFVSQIGEDAWITKSLKGLYGN